MATSSNAVTVLQTTGVPEFGTKTNWKIWSEQLEIHFCELNCVEENQKKAILLKSIGAETYSVLHSLCDPVSPASKTYKELCSILATHFTPPTIIFSERKNFHTAQREDGESVSEWYARVKKLALNCKFGAHLDIMILDRFVIGLPKEIFERLCEDDENIKLEQALKKAMIIETKLTTRIKAEDTNVNNINRRIGGMQNKKNNGHAYGSGSSGRHSSNSGNNSSGGSGSGGGSGSRGDSGVGRKGSAKCRHCGWGNHEEQNCKFRDSKCFSCKRYGHIASVCRSKRDNIVNYVSDSDSDMSANNIFDYSIFSIKSKFSCGLYSLPVTIDGVNLNAACDTGAPCTLVPYSFCVENNIKANLRECQTPYVNYSGDRIVLVGEYDAAITYEGQTKKITVVVTDTSNPPLLGRSFLRAFNFELKQINSINITNNCAVIVNQLKDRYSALFEDGVGTFKNFEISLELVDHAKPIFFKPRSVPLAWKGKVETKLRKMVEDGLLEQVDNSDWGTPLVPVLKPNGDLRICADYKVTLNKYLADFKYPLPRIEEIFATLQGGELFTKLDLANAYNQLMLDEKSQLLCSWSTHIGTFKVKRLPFGIKVAAGIFQKTMENLLREIPNVVVYQDDITVTGRNNKEHLDNLTEVLAKLQYVGLKLNQNKCTFFQPQISYLGFTIDKNGLSKTNSNISSIINAPIPKNISEVRAFTGMVNYYSKFIENFATKMSPLYALLQKNNNFVWSRKCQESYDTIKAEITSDRVLAHYNPQLPIVLTTDASGSAVAGVLSHQIGNDLKPIAFVSRALTKSEKNYSTLEKEALAIIFCVTKLRQYLLGNTFILNTDHKPLTTIFGEHKGLPIMASARLQRWALILSGFNYTVKHIKGVWNQADGLSRMPQSVLPKERDEISYVNLIESESEMFLNFKSVARETMRDPILSKVCVSVLRGTLNSLEHDDFIHYRKKEVELSVEYNCILWGYRVVIPLKLRSKVLQHLHRSHLGMVKTKALARSYVWWPGIDRDIEHMIKSCNSCQELQSSPEKSSLIPWNPTDSAWSRIHMDYAGPIQNYYLLIIIDSFSKFAEVFKTKDLTSAFAISKVRELFCRYGLVDVIVSDNGSQFISNEFRTFLRINGVKQILTAPGHPATNGQAENFVKILKKSVISILKSDDNCSLDTALNRFLIDYRNTTHLTTGETPAKLFFGRSLKTRFCNLRPPLTRQTIIGNQTKSILNNKGKRNAEFTTGQNVLIRDYSNPNKASWSQATVKKKLGPRSYSCVFTHNNREIKRHLDQIRSGGIDHRTNDDGTSLQEEASSHGNVTHEEIVHSSVPIRTGMELRPRREGKVIHMPEID